MMSYEEWLEELCRENNEDSYYEYLAYVEPMKEEANG